MRYRFYKTRGIATFWAVRLTRNKTPKMVPGHPNCAYGVRPKFAHLTDTAYYGGIIDLSTIHDYTDRCPKKEALTGMGEYGYLITQTGLQFRHSISSGVYAITRLSNNQPVVSGKYRDKIHVYRNVAGETYSSTVCVETLHLDKVISAKVAAKYDPKFVKTLLVRFAPFTA